MRVNFNVRKPVNDRCIIYAVITYNNKRISFSTKLYCNINRWDKDKQRERGNVELNSKLQQMENVCYETYERNTLFGDISAERLKRVITDAVFNPDKNRNNLLLPYYYKWATEKGLGRNPSRQKLLCYNTLKYYAKKGLSFDDVTKRWIEEYLLSLEERNFSLNYIGTHLKNLKAVMNAAYEDKLHDNTDYKKFKKMEEDSDAIYLTTKEIDRIENLKGLPKRDEIARDLFLIGYYTAMRFSDYSKLSMANFDGDTLKFATKKTGAVVVLPVNKKLVAILNKYNGHSPRMTESELNVLIKDVCSRAEINDIIPQSKTVGGKIVTTYKVKYTLVSSHTARRSGTTNMYLAGIKPESIMMITGHKTYSSFKKYIRIDKITNADMLKENEFFHS